jgi:hypothetical protein
MEERMFRALMAAAVLVVIGCLVLIGARSSGKGCRR